MLKHFRSGSKRIRTLWWILTIGTVVTFISGFIFIFGSGVGDVDRALTTPSVVGSVGGKPISQAELASATQTALAQYKAQYGAAPTGRDAAILEEQVWNNLLTERAIEAEAKRLGLKVTDEELVFAVKNTPPPDVAQSPAYQTNGRFDPQKWAQALSDPTLNWSPLEDRMRRSLPGQHNFNIITFERRLTLRGSRPPRHPFHELTLSSGTMSTAIQPRTEFVRKTASA